MSRDLIDTTLAGIRPDRQLHYENYQVVSFVQALCGTITPNMVAVSLKCLGAEVHLHYYIENDSVVDREAIDDATTDLESLQFTNVPILTHVHLVGASLKHSQIEGRHIYHRYEVTTGG